MNEDTIADFKQFITTIIKQENAEIRADIARLDKKVDNLDKKVDNLDKKVDNLDKKVDDVLIAVADTTNDRFEVLEGDITDLQSRVGRLEAA